MHQSRIDTLTRLAAQQSGRRSFTTRVLAALLAGLVPGRSSTGATASSNATRRKRPRCRKPKRRCGKRCVNVQTSRQHCGTCNRRCEPGHVCDHGRCRPPSPPACGQGGPCRAFVTSSFHDGRLGGLAGADNICNLRASEGGLPGEYMAWLAMPDQSPADRFTKNPGPYIRTDGAVIARSWADLTDGSLHAAINYMVDGKPQPREPFAWSGTTPAGTSAGPNLDCNGWTDQTNAYKGGTGDSDMRDGRWTTLPPSNYGCETPRHLYCFQQT